MQQLLDAAIGDGCEAALRVAASTLSHARRSQIAATTVVRRLGDDDPDAIERLVQDVARAYHVHATLHLATSSFVVRFSR
jgi:hypothetical protein